LRAVLGLAQARSPSIKANISKDGHILILYNVSENDIDLIEIPIPDGKSHQNVHFISIYPYFENESVSNPIRVYGLHDMVHQTYRQEQANAYSKLTTEATFRPFSKLGIPSLTDKLSIIGSSVGVSENTKGKKKLFVILLGNDSNDSNIASNAINIIEAAAASVVPGTWALAFVAEHFGWLPSLISYYADTDAIRMGVAAEPMFSAPAAAEQIFSAPAAAESSATTATTDAIF
jgi:hypothetical protein